MQKKQKVEPSYYLRKKKQLERKRTKRKYSLIVIFLLIAPAIAITSQAHSLKTAQDELIRSISDNQAIETLRAQNEAHRAKLEILNKYDEQLAKMGKMGQAIKQAGIEFGETEEEAVNIIGLAIGIANAESSLGRNFIHEYDSKCHNWWGIKPPSGKRDDGSYLRCLVDETAGARTFASLIKRLNIDQGLTTPETIVNKWVGANQSRHHAQWLANVNKYYKQ